MANISRDTFKLTNVMHSALTGEPVEIARHYVSVIMQQGVPVLDADLNEAADIERVAARLLLDHFLGDGIPFGSDGFQITEIEQDNDFLIRPGIALVGGMLVFNPHTDLRYTRQGELLAVDVPALDPPASDTRHDLVYLDVWEEEVSATGDPRADPRLVHERIGMETARRIERRWAVRVEPGAEEVGEVALPSGHRAMALAVLRRTSTPRITTAMIADQRRTDLNVARYLKVPVRVTRAGTTVDSETLAGLYHDLRMILTRRIADDLLFVPVGDPERTATMLAAQNILHQCATIALQSRTHGLNRDDALEACRVASEGQGELLGALAGHAPFPSFVSPYQARLQTVYSRIAERDLVGAYEAQALLNAWLSAPLDHLPEGNVTVNFLSVEPNEALAAGVSYIFALELFNQLAGNIEPEEVFDISFELTSGLWSIGDFDSELTVAAHEMSTFTVQVTPHADDETCTLNILARARRNPAIDDRPSVGLQLGTLPPVGRVLAFTGPRDELGRALIRASRLSPNGELIRFTLTNRGDSPEDYEVRLWVTLPDEVEPDGWPSEEEPRTRSFAFVDPGIFHNDIRLVGPADTLGVEGELTLQLIDPEEEIRIPFVVIV